MNNKGNYKEYCKEVYVPLFSRSWWMDAVCEENNWDVFLVGEGKDIQAAMPYYLLNDDKKPIITKAPLTQNNGLLIKYPNNQKYCSRLDYEERIINKACNHIEGLGLAKYEQQYHYSFSNWLPFYWREYSELTRYTYVIEDTSDMAAVEAGFDSKLRNILRKAQSLVEIIDDITPRQFYDVNKMTFARQDISIPYSFEFFERLYYSCLENNCGKMLCAIDSRKNLHSVEFLVWDEESVYHLLNGTNPQFKASQANALLIFEGIKLAAEMERKFDFEGSVIKPIEKAFRAYGGIQKPYFRISKKFE